MYSLETERLLIRPLEMDDYDFIRKLVNTEGWLSNIGDRNVTSRDDAKAYIRKILGNRKYHCSTFRLKEINEPIGIITFIYRDTQKFPDIGYAMLPEYERKGFAYEAVKRYLNKLKAEKITDRVGAITLPANKRSIRLLERLGFSLAYRFIENNSEIALYLTEMN